jgi:hypothetical protein
MNRRFDLDLRLDAPAPYDDAAVALAEESQQVRALIYKRLGLKAHSGKAWITLDLESAKGWSVLEKLIEECRARRVMVGSAIAREKLDADADWFQLETRPAYDSFSLWDDYPSYKSGTHPEGHALNATFVSEAFVATVERAGLRGIAFLRCLNKGRKPGPPWHAALPEHSLGRGVDHPWFDRRRWLCDVGDDPKKRSSPLHTGQHQFHQCWLRDDLGADTEFVQELLALCPTPKMRTPLRGLDFLTIPRYWAQALPDADFAYLPFGEDGPNREGKILRFRKLAVSRRARETLIDAGLFIEKAFLPFRTVTMPENGVGILDGRYEPITPMYTAEELAVLRAKEKKLFGPSAEGLEKGSPV